MQSFAFPHRTHDLRSGCQDYHPSKNSVQKTVYYNSTSNAPDDGRMYPKNVELRNTSIKLPCCINLAVQIISPFRIQLFVLSAKVLVDSRPLKKGDIYLHFWTED